jgi:CRP-like cAMP-binding protein
MTKDFFNYSGAETEPTETERPTLGNFTAEDWDHFITFAARRRYATGAVIAKAGDTDQAVFIIVAGSVSIEGPNADRVARRDLGAGDLFGIETFLVAGERGASAVATDAVEVLMLSEEGLEQLAAWRPRIALRFVRFLAADVAFRLRKFETPL